MARSSISTRALRTPPRSTRGNPTFSYAEPPTSDDDLEEEENGDVDEQSHSDISHAPPTRRSRARTRNVREPRSANNKPQVAITKSTRQKPVISYAESSTDHDSEEEEEEEEDDNEDNEPSYSGATHTPRARLSRNASHSRSSAKRSQCNSHESTPKRRKQNQSASRKRSRVQSPAMLVENPEAIPPWQTLPYHVLVQIFEYATYPLYEERTFQPLPSGRWLLDVAYLCRGFAEPAFTVLYNSPPLVPMDKAHG